MLSREYGTLAGAGGVKDVACQLAETLARWTGRSVSVVLPLYGFLDALSLGFHPLMDPLCSGQLLQVAIDMHLPDRRASEEVGYYYQRINKVHVYLVDGERFRNKSDIYTYTEEDEKRVPWQKKSMGHHDYFAMNVLHQKAALELMINIGERPQVIHCHDGHSALLPALIRETPGYRSYFRGSGCLVTVHNAGYGYHQEIADIPYARSITGLSGEVIDANQLDRKFDPFLVAGRYAMLNTVSENYARELQETSKDQLTGGLGHELKRRGVEILGVTNGIDPDTYSPTLLAADNPELMFDPGKSSDNLLGKSHCKSALLRQIAAGEGFKGVTQFGTLTDNLKWPLFTFIGRLSEQKGIDTLAEVFEVLLEKEHQLQLLVFGSGGTSYESKLINLAADERFAGRICFLKGFSPALANRIYAAGDFFVVPSRYEPCGLTDFIAQLFGNIPVVHHVGGLVKVKDGLTGISYKGESPDALFEAIKRALALYTDTVMKRNIQQQAVEEIHRSFSWTRVMQRYMELYRQARKVQLCQ